MTYRDQFDALQAETEKLQRKLSDAQEELDSLRARVGGAEAEVNEGPLSARGHDAQRWAFGMRCLGGVSLMLPFLLMTTMCERSFTPRYHRAQVVPVAAAMGSVMTPRTDPRPLFIHQCNHRTRPAPGYERFTSTTSRSARVTSAAGYTGIAAGTSCTLSVVPSTLTDFTCHVEVVCNGTTVYGSLPSGYAHCDVDGPTLLRASDAETTAQDGDPSVHIDLLHGVGLVSDSSDAGPRWLHLAIDQPLSLDRQ